MFTGIITNIAEIVDIIELGADREVHVKADLKHHKLNIGQSIACDGICLTVTKIMQSEDNKEIMVFFISQETIDKTIVSLWQIKDKINLEFAMSNDSLFDGHMVTGHVDITAKIKNIIKQEASYIIEINLANEYLEYLISKGSVTVNGVSLTVNKLNKDSFMVNIIPHTWDNTNLKYLTINSLVNIEVDIMAKYIKKYYNNDKK